MAAISALFHFICVISSNSIPEAGFSGLFTQKTMVEAVDVSSCPEQCMCEQRGGIGKAGSPRRPFLREGLHPCRPTCLQFGVTGIKWDGTEAVPPKASTLA